MEKIILKVMFIAGIIIILYGILVFSLIGVQRVFNYFYLATGGLFVAMALLWPKISSKIGLLPSRIIMAAFFAIITFFLIVEIQIITFGNSKPDKDADYVILLGSQMWNSGPSMDYQARIEAAYEYLIDNPKTKLIATGARGRNEPCSEAQGAADYLIRKGIDRNRIIIEDNSYSTLENITNAKQLILKESKDPVDCKVVIVSATYHLYRAAYIAKKLGFKDISVKGSNGLFALLPQYYTREFFGMIKEWLL